MNAKQTNFVCFKCRTASRGPWRRELAFKCPACKSGMEMLHFDTEIPRKKNATGWKKLEKFFRDQQERFQKEQEERTREIEKWERERNKK